VSIKLTYKNYKKVDVIIFYKDLSEDIIEHVIPTNLSSKIIDVDSEILINFRLALFFVRNIFKIKRRRGVLSYLNRVYYYSYIEYLQPSVVVTFIDNSALFQWLSNHYRKANFFAIQNGNRLKVELQSSYKNNLTFFFCFGRYEENQYLKYGHSANCFIPVGSIRASIYEKKSNPVKLKYDIAIISSYFLPLPLENEISKMEGLLLKMHQNIKQYMLNNPNLSYIVLCKHKEDSSEGFFEKKYYESIYGHKVQFRFQDESGTSTYKGIKQSKVIVSCCSTSGSEAIGWGKKVLFCDYSFNNSFADFKDGIWLTTNKNYDKFSNKMDKIISMNCKDYNILTSDYFDHIMSRDNRISTIDKIKEIAFPITTIKK
jgi:surface carbohydrate biosynthesis protein